MLPSAVNAVVKPDVTIVICPNQDQGSDQNDHCVIVVNRECLS